MTPNDEQIEFQHVWSVTWENGLVQQFAEPEIAAIFDVSPQIAQKSIENIVTSGEDVNLFCPTVLNKRKNVRRRSPWVTPRKAARNGTPLAKKLADTATALITVPAKVSFQILTYLDSIAATSAENNPETVILHDHATHSVHSSWSPTALSEIELYVTLRGCSDVWCSSHHFPSDVRYTKRH